MATATGSRQPRRRNGDQLRREPKARNCQTKEILPPNCKSVQKNKNNSGLQSPFLLTRLVHFQAAIWHNLSPLLTEAHCDYLLGLIRRTPDMTLLEIKERLIANCGERFSVSVLWRFFDRHEITVKKRPHTPRSSSARTS